MSQRQDLDAPGGTAELSSPCAVCTAVFKNGCAGRQQLHCCIQKWLRRLSTAAPLYSKLAAPAVDSCTWLPKRVFTQRLAACTQHMAALGHHMGLVTLQKASQPCVTLFTGLLMDTFLLLMHTVSTHRMLLYGPLLE